MGKDIARSKGFQVMGMLYLPLLLILHLALTLARWSFAGLNEPISDNGGPEHTFVFPRHILRMALTLRRGPILVAQHPGNNGLVQGGQLIGCAPQLASTALTFSPC